MAIGFFALALFLFLGLDLDHGSPSSASAASSEGVEITYGSVLKLMHEKTKFRLHSHDVPYGSGSGQQSVTGFPNVDDSNSYWIVRPQPGTSAKQGDTIKSGTIIRLQHMRTRKWLHSHLHASPISGNLEVSCFGGDSDSDSGDYWRLMIEGSGKTWKQEQRVRLQHIDTGGYHFLCLCRSAESGRSVLTTSGLLRKVFIFLFYMKLSWFLNLRSVIEVMTIFGQDLFYRLYNHVFEF